MPSLPFTKLHGAGNDFIVVERRELERSGVPEERTSGLAKRICDRRFGVGADGLEVVGSSKVPGAITKAQLWNSDGSEAEISGNGTRCVAAYLTAIHRAPARFVIETGSGPREVQLMRRAPPDFEFRMRSAPDACRIVDDELWLDLAGSRYLVTAVDVGNPQCVHLVESLDFDWMKLGSAMERHPHFPDGSNVSFVALHSGAGQGTALEVRFWERGAGATLSSGTGSLGAAVAARHHGWIDDNAVIRTEGGSMNVDWGDGIRLTGPACLVACGTYELCE